MTDLLSDGRVVFSREDALRELGISKHAFLAAAERQQRRKHLIHPQNGFYIIVPPQYLAWEAPPPTWYIDGLMQHKHYRYYVGLLKAAELHGASHQAVMEFQVITGKQLPRIRIGRSAIAFYYRKNMSAVTNAIEERKTDTGNMKVSSIELTLLDLIRYPHGGGGLDNVVTVLSELSDRINPSKLSKISSAFERSIVQRLGYLLDRFAKRELTRPLFKAISQDRSLPWVELEPILSTNSDFTPEPIEWNERWHVVVRRKPEPDA